MSFRSLRILAAAAALLATGAAQAYINGPVVWYSGTLDFSCPTTLPSGDVVMSPSDHSFSEPSLVACQTEWNNTYQYFMSQGCEVVEQSLCAYHFVPFRVTAEEHMSPAIFNDFVRSERVLRERYRIDQYEIELKDLYKRSLPTR